MTSLRWFKLLVPSDDMKFSTSVSLISRNTGHKPIHNHMGQQRWTSLIIKLWQIFLGFYTLLTIHRTRKYGSPQSVTWWLIYMCRTSSQGNACNQYCVLTLTIFLWYNLLVCACSKVKAEKFANKASKSKFWHHCYDLKPVRKEEGKFYWKIPLGDDDATRGK